MPDLKKKSLRFSVVTLATLCMFSFFMVYFKGCWWPMQGEKPGEKSGPEAVIENYGADIKKYAKEYKLDPGFLAALCMLESSGRKPVPFRFEKHVYTRLKMVQLRVRDSYEHVKPENLC